MGLKTILFAGVFALCVLAGLVAPIWALCGYVMEYSWGAGGQWWGAPLRAMGLRLSLTLAAAVAVGFFLNYPAMKSRFGRSPLVGQEWLILAFLGLVWLSTVIGEATAGRYSITDHPTIKMTKTVVLVLLMTHIVTTFKDLKILVWTLIVGAMLLGVDAYRMPYRAFVRGRLEGIGGPDFSESNFFAAYMAMLLPLIGVQFLRSGRWGKLLCLAAGAFTANAVILTRSRGAVVGLAAGAVMAVLLAPPRRRMLIVGCLVVVLAGGIYLADPQFFSRASTITRTEEERDKSAQSRIELAKAGLRILSDRPFGIGAGNFYQTIGHYLPGYEGRDAHNTYVRCFTEIGIQGGLVFLLLIANALRTLMAIRRDAALLPEEDHEEVIYYSFALILLTSVLFTCCLTISLTYVEFLWWVLALPVCLQRCLENRLAQIGEAASGFATFVDDVPLSEELAVHL